MAVTPAPQPSMMRKIRVLLTAREQRDGIVLLGLMIVGTGLETLGIGLVIPAISLLMDPGGNAAAVGLAPLLAWLGHPTRVQLISYGMLLLVGVYLVKNAFLAFLIWYQTRFAFGVQENISRRLFDTYLRQPYTFHLQRNSAELVRNTVGEVQQLWFLVLGPAMIVSSEAMVLVGLVALLLVVEPIGALLVVLVLGAASWGFYHTTHARMAHWGAARQRHDGLRIQQVQQGLGGAKEVKLRGVEDEFLARYQLHNAESARVGQHYSALQQLPRMWIELLAVAGLAALVVVMLAQGQTAERIVPTLGLFGAAAFRLMPSTYRALGALQNLPYGRPVIDTLFEELSLVPVDAPPQVTGGPITFTREIRLVDVGYAYPLTHTPSLDRVSLVIRNGESVGFIGPSGSGKSTLIDVILGLLTQTTGRVLVDGADIRQNLRGWQDQIGYVPQTVYLTDESLRANVAFGVPRERIDDAAVHRAIRAAQLDGFVASHPDGLETIVGEHGMRLSGGQRQRIGIARALYHDPAILVLDEATSALDVATERDVMDAVRALQGNKTMLIVAHRLSTVEHCTRLYRLEGGRIAAETLSGDVPDKDATSVSRH